MYLSHKTRPASDADARDTFPFSPPAGAMHPLETRELTDTATRRDSFDLDNLANNLDRHTSSARLRPTPDDVAAGKGKPRRVAVAKPRGA